MSESRDCKGICDKFMVDRPPVEGRLKAGQVLCGQCGTWISQDGAYKNSEVDEDATSVPEWYCRCCDHKAGKELSNDGQGVELSYISKSRVKIIQRITRLLPWEETKSSITLLYTDEEVGAGLSSGIAMEFDAQIHEIIDLAYTRNPPNKLSMIMEFERIREMIGKVPEKQDIDRYSEIPAALYDVEFQSWGHLIERLGYDPWYRDIKTDSKEPEEAKPSIDLHGEEWDTDTIDIGETELAIEYGLLNEPDILQLFKTLCRVIPDFDKDKLKDIVDRLE